MMRYIGIATCLALSVVIQGCKEKPVAAVPPPIPVLAAPVIVRDTPVMSENIGQTRGSREITVQARVEGVLESIHFEEGQPVKEGQLLYTIDPKPCEAALNQARANMARASASALKARQDVARYTPLLEKHAISRQQFDDAVAAEQANAASVDAAAASVDSATLQLGYTRVSASVAGLAGRSEVSVGNLVGRGQPTLLTTISQLDPIHVRFSVSEKEYLAWQHGAAKEAGKREREPFELLLADGTLHDARGKAVFADREVDPSTGTLMIEVEFPNPKGVVRPGQYARVRFPLSVQKGAVLVPQRAVQEMQATYSVVVVSPDRKAEFRPVQVGTRIGSFWVIEQGLHAGETIVIEGVQKLRPGASLAPTLTNLTETVSTP